MSRKIPSSQFPRSAEKKKELLHHSRRVVSYEIDGFGHVNNAVYLQYLEAARMDFMHQKGLGYCDFSKWKRFPVVVRAHLEFKTPARADDDLSIDAFISAHSATSFTLRYEMTRVPDRKLVLQAETVHVFVDESGRPTRIPQEFFDKFIAPAK